MSQSLPIEDEFVSHLKAKTLTWQWYKDNIEPDYPYTEAEFNERLPDVYKLWEE